MEVQHARPRLKWLTVPRIVVFLYIFLCGIKMLGTACKALEKQPFVHDLIAETSNPFVGLFVGILVTSIIQSSSATTSIVIGIVAQGTLGVRAAIPIIMGANIGTTVTNTLVSLGYVMRKEEFRRALSGAVVHDLFNVFVVLILFPVELGFRVLETVATWLTNLLPTPGGGTDIKRFEPLRYILDPPLKQFYALLGGEPSGPDWRAGVVLAVGLVCIFFALLMLVRVLRSIMLGRAEVFITRVLGKSGWMGIAVGLVITMTVQSSSITTSVMVPMAAAGIVTVLQIFPITIGANIGTTVTGLIASLAGGKHGAFGVTVACVHCMFNIIGMLIFYPIPALRRLPCRVAERIGRFASESRRATFLYVFCLFYLVPALCIFLYRWLW